MNASSIASFPVEGREQRSPMNAHRPFLPILLGLAAFLIWTIFQTTQLVGQRSSLSKTHEAQAALLEQSQKVRAANDSLAGKTQRLADAGNATAQFVTAQLKQRGITINPNAATQSPPK
jgi:hypothetical protein